VWVCETERPVVLTGMHRSGTSLVARLFVEAGVDFGSELLGTAESNLAGHFEDQAFLSFHERVLVARDPSKRVLWLPPPELAWSSSEREEAEHLVRARVGRAPWGWKDPRTVLFLESWRELLPKATFCLLFRSPAQVVSSLRRRRDRNLIVKVLGRSLTRGRRRGPFRYRRAIQAWLRYNERILRFADAHPDQTLVIELESLLESPDPTFERLQHRFGLSLSIPWDRAYEARLLTTSVHPRVTRMLAKYPEVAALHARLRERASDHCR
jgi:O-antigen biosynthesis protein